MTRKRSPPADAPPSLRERAEASMRATRADIGRMPAEEVQRLVHELQVHQIELEMQNEELRRAQAELAQSHDRFADLYDFAPVGYLTLDHEGTVREANLTVAAMLGVAREKLVGRKFTRFVARAGQDALYLHQHAVLDGGKKQICELLLLHGPDRTTFPARMETIGLRDSASGTHHCRSAIIDITERQRAEEALARSHAELERRVVERTEDLRQAHQFSESLIDTVQSIVLLLSPEGRILRFNRHLEELSGWSRDEACGQDWFDLFLPPRDGARSRELFQRAIGGRNARGSVNPIVTKDGRELEIEWHDALLQDADGRLVGLLCSGRDITAQRRAAADLREREERLRAILNTVADGVITFDRAGTISGVNPATERMFGYPGAEMIGQNIRLLLPSPDREEHDGHLANDQRTGPARIIGLGRDAWGRRQDGTVFPIDLAVSEVGPMHLFTGVIRDISERKRLEAEVLRIGEEERRRVAADLHDGICQEMVGIQYLALLLLRDLEKARHPLAAQARRIEEAVVKTTIDTREVARGLNPVVADGSGLMHALRQLAAMTARARRVRCLFQCPEPVSIENPTTANELYRIAQEAIHNAVRHSRAPRITVRLSAPGGDVCLAVIDNGCGLPADVSGAPGMGLRVMKYRARVIGGQFTIQPRRRGGTEVLCRVAKSSAHP